MAMFDGLLGDACDGVLMELPHLYLVHGLDDDIFHHRASFVTLADLLQPCRLCVLGFDEASDRCSSLAELAALYNQRVLEDVRADEPPVARGGADADVAIVLIGYGFGAIVVHQMALQFQVAGRRVGLVLLDSEVAWPPASPGRRRLGGYPWRGGAAEAALLMCRALGASDVAEEEVGRLLDGQAGEPDADAVEEAVMRAFWGLAGVAGMTYPYFLDCLRYNAYVLQRMFTLSEKDGSAAGMFEGDALLLRASDSPEFEDVRATNLKFCSQLEVVSVPGTHYNLAQRRKEGVPTALPQAISEFLLLRGYFGPAAQQAVRAAARRQAPDQDKLGSLARPGLLEFAD